METFQPLFHLLNGDLADGDPPPATQSQVWRDFGNDIEASAANRPWMPVPGNHAVEYLARYALPDNGRPEFAGRWYEFRIGNVAFICLSADDVAGGVADGVADGYSGGAQTRWLEATLAAARATARSTGSSSSSTSARCSSSRAGDGSGLGIRREWLPLFDRYEVDLVLCGHEHGYERSFPVRGFDSADTLRPHPVTTTDSGVFDTSQGTVHLALGCGGDADPGSAGATEARAGTETAPWSARRDTETGYGIAVFDVNPGTEAGGQTSITVRYYHAVDADPAQGIADRRLRAVRDVHPGQATIRRTSLAPERATVAEPPNHLAWIHRSGRDAFGRVNVKGCPLSWGNGSCEASVCPA